ncbi:GDSL-type esterase/lipase family protein [Asticcacaulis sp. AC402]|uniref:GDSL-type esterase/lipase family protein n=1 Tax=Asticcacaulis sp. AC402 TaxID=1282361 RepID=UPI0003C3B6FE|nr:GDSL-type esterase/lipase family protein [Asticcacaulis sp. AC402]ESQ76083.1 hypothetical protein ABAC402_06450 [Asticcacaulis sp. AC402]
MNQLQNIFSGKEADFKRSAGLMRLACTSIFVLGIVVAPQTGSSQDFQSGKAQERVEYWQKRQSYIDAFVAADNNLSAIKLVFLGDSITDFWTLKENPWVKGQMCGGNIWAESFSGVEPENLALNLGISGDRTEHILFRLLPKSSGGLGQLDRPELHPDYIILLAGINNTWAGEDPVADSVYEGIKAIVIAAHERKPHAKIVLQSLLPTSDPIKNREVVIPVNQRLLELSESPSFSPYVRHLDLYPSFLDSTGNQIESYFNDGLHPNEAGYRVWRDRLVAFLRSERKTHLS